MDKEFKSGVTDWSVKKKSNLYKFEKGVLQAIGEKFGTEFIILDESSEINAKYLTGTNRIVVYRNADGGVMLRSAAHETYHFVEGYSSSDAANLRDYVIEALKENGTDIDKALEKYAKQGYATRDEQISELVADSMFDVFSNEDFIKELTAKNQTLAKRLANHIGELVQKIREAVKMLSVRYSNPEIKALMDDAEKLDTIRNMLLEGYKNASENFKAEQAKGQKNNAGGAAVKSKKEKIVLNMDDYKRAEILNKTNITPIKMDGNKIEPYEIETLKTNYKKEAKKTIENLVKKCQENEIYIYKNYMNEEIEIDFSFGSRRLNESLNKQNKNYNYFAQMLLHLDDLMNNAVLIEAHNDKYKGTRREDPSLKSVYVLLSALKENENIIIPVQFEIKEFIDKENKLYLAVTLNKIEVNISGQTFAELSDENNPPLTSDISITEIIKNINPVYGDFLKYIPSGLLNDIQLKAKEDALNKDREKIAQLKEEKRTNQKFSIKQDVDEQKQNQLDIINETNPAPNTYSTWIRSVDDIKTLAETLEDDEWDYEEFNPDLTRADIQNAIESGEITVYSSYPIKNGVFVSPSRMEAEATAETEGFMKKR